MMNCKVIHKTHKDDLSNRANLIRTLKSMNFDSVVWNIYGKPVYSDKHKLINSDDSMWSFMKWCISEVNGKGIFVNCIFYCYRDDLDSVLKHVMIQNTGNVIRFID